MHDSTMLRDLVAAAERAAVEADLGSVAAVRVRIGALAGISPSHLAEHFEEAVEGTLLQGSRLIVEQGPDGIEALDDPAAQGVLLLGLDGGGA
jgi:hydrogenase nickel incorporation protein HypA/HybF